MTRLAGGVRGGRHWPATTRALFAGYPPFERRGLWFPGMGWLAQWSRSGARALDRVGCVFPFCYLTEQVLFVLRKPLDAAGSHSGR